LPKSNDGLVLGNHNNSLVMTFWVLRIIVANVGMFLISLVAPQVVPACMLVPIWVFARPWTLITYMFLHANVWHLFFNMLGLYFFGPRLELEIGSRHFFWLYLVSGLMGAALSFVFTPYTSIVGASGAIFGVLYGFAHFWPREQIYIWGVLPIEARWLVIGMAALSLFGGFGGGGGNIAHFAHLGGFVGGFAYIRWLGRRKQAGTFGMSLPSVSPSTIDLKRWSRIPRERLHEVNRAELDRIMVKINTTGPQSLSLQERAFLDRFSTDT
jgi:membrane associated rhomboid family serine protease